MKIISPPKIITGLYHSLEWAMPAGVEKKIYLSFDDGPTPSITNFVLNELMPGTSSPRLGSLQSHLDTRD